MKLARKSRGRIVFWTGIMVFSSLLITAISGLKIVTSNNKNDGNNASRIIVSSNHAPIFINGEAGLAAFPDKTGSGTPNDPYIIENMIINIDNGSHSAIYLWNTISPIIIRNCTAANQVDPIWDGFGIIAWGCQNVQLVGNMVHGNEEGIYLGECKDSIAAHNILFNNTNDLTIRECRDCNIMGNTASISTINCNLTTP
jgi:parallel beta-helix repeat protein